MSIKRRIVKAAAVGAIASTISQLGFYLCFFAGGSVRLLAYEFCSVLAFWPVAFVTLFGASESFQWPMLNIISFLGWLLLAFIVALMFHFMAGCLSRKTDEKPVA